jgi:hypothetical protein
MAEPLVHKLKERIVEGTSAELVEQTAGVADRDVQFDASRVTVVNSLGMGEFVRFVQSLARRNRVTFARCSPVFTDFLTLMRGAMAVARVASFVLEFSCDNCRTETRVETPAATLKLALSPPACARCKAPMQLHGDPAVLSTLVPG